MFLATVHDLIAEGGWLAISLPNVAFWKGRVKFILKGELWGFGARHYRGQRHISPITHAQMLLLLPEMVFEVVTRRTAGSFATGWSWAITSPLWMPSGR